MASSLSAACKPIRTGPRRRSKSGGFRNASVHTNANVSTEALEAARQRIQYVFTQIAQAKRYAHSGTGSQKPGADSGNAEERMERGPRSLALASSGKLYTSA